MGKHRPTRPPGPRQVPRLALSPRVIGTLVALTLVAGATDVWMQRRARQASGAVSPARAATAPETRTAVAPPVQEQPVSLVAESTVPLVRVHGSPEGKLTHRLAHPTENGVPLVFLVQRQDDGWLKVYLPVRPNGSTGWIRERDVELTQHSYRIVVRLKDHRLLAFEGGGEQGRLILAADVGVGTANTPTPGGTYYIKELLRPRDPNSVYGKYAYGLSGFSNVLQTFRGGPGVIGIHGTNDPSSIGRDVSAGCIRMRNRDIAKLVKILPLGTPVEIQE
ncbi:MAG TPA: L,D-transpeptidase [Actinomycetota bacterium]|nr:L,D-transpeptidase [Actinomycetota bacterium]